MDLDFSEDEIRRYARHILLDEVGGAGQARLRAARVLIVGAGGLGSPLALYLAAAGVGTIGIADDDVVELSNLQRQVAHGSAWIGTGKAASAAAAMASINPLVRIVQHPIRVDGENVAALIAPYDIVCDGTDNFEARFLLADTAWHAGKTLVSAAVLRFEGQLATFRPGRAADGSALPCYRCLYPAPPPAGLQVSCAETGVMGPVTGVMGTLQATEVLKEILGIGESLAGRLLIWDALATRFRVVRLPNDPGCAVCGGFQGSGALMRRTPPARTYEAPEHAIALPEHKEPGPGRPAGPLGILLLSAAHDRSHFAFMTAAAAAALGRSVLLFASNSGCRALRDDWSHLEDSGRDAAIRRRGVAGLGELREAARELGVRMIACEAGLRAEAIDVASLWSGVEVAGLATFLEAIGGGR